MATTKIIIVKNPITIEVSDNLTDDEVEAIIEKNGIDWRTWSYEDSWRN